MSAHLTVAQGIGVGFAAGAVVAGVVAEWFTSRLRDRLDAMRHLARLYDRRVADLEEELADTRAERDGFRMHLDTTINELDAAVARHPAGRALTPHRRLHAVEGTSLSSPAAAGPRTVAAGNPTRNRPVHLMGAVTEERATR